MSELKDLKVAIIHYWMVTWRGGEKVVESLLKLFPNADIYTLFYDEEACGTHLMGYDVTSSILDTPILRKNYQKIFPLYPLGIKSLKLKKKYDLILSSESGPAKGINRLPLNEDTPHICYTHTPMRYCYGYMEEYLNVLPQFARPMARINFKMLKKWDLGTVSNVDLYLANSDNVKHRIEKHWNRKAKVVYPPIALSIFEKPLVPSKKEYYLSFGAITPYKNIDLLVETFNQNGKPLVVIGEGSEKARLKAKANPNIRFLGFLENWEVDEWVQNARALLFPGEEDFGMIPLEVMARGIPVIAYKKGGALETVVESRDSCDKGTGIFFEENSVSSLNEALEAFEARESCFEPEFIRAHARTFGEDVFLVRMRDTIEEFLRTPRVKRC